MIEFGQWDASRHGRILIDTLGDEFALQDPTQNGRRADHMCVNVSLPFRSAAGSQATQGSWSRIPADLETSEYEDKGSLVHTLTLGVYYF